MRLLKALFVLFACLAVRSSEAQVVLQRAQAVVTHYGDTTNTYLNDSSHYYVAHIKKIESPKTTSGAILGANWLANTPVHNWRVDVLGQIFGVAIDKDGNVYFASSSCNTFPYTSQLGQATVPSLHTGGATSAGLWGFNSAGGAGGIYKADKTDLNIVTTLVSTGSGANQIPNSGYGLGNIAYNKIANCLYATNLEDGKIYKVDLPGGTISAVLDPFAADNGAAGIAPYDERLFAVGVNYEFDGTTRLYFSRQLAPGNQSEIHSVGLAANGNFSGPVSLEIVVPQSAQATYISDLAFSVRGELALSEKGDPHKAKIYEYFGRHNAWSVALNIKAGNNASGFTGSNSAGGIDFGEYDGNSPLTCDSLLWFTSNCISPAGGSSCSWYGLQSAPASGYVNSTANLFINEAYISTLNYQPQAKGGFGDVEIYDADSCNGTPTDICSLLNAEAQAGPLGPCCYDIRVKNNYNDKYFTGISIETGGNLTIANYTAGTTWGGFSYVSPTKVVFSDSLGNTFVPEDPGFFTLAKLCFAGSGTDQLTIKWIGNAPQYDTVCVQTLDITGCTAPVDTNCAAILDPRIICDSGVYKMQFQVKNNSTFTMRGITLYPLNPDVVPVQSFLPIADLAPGQTSPVLSVLVQVANNDTSACFFFAACDLNVAPGTSGQYPQFCCMDSIEYCMSIPPCDICDGIKITATPQNGNKCCYKLSLNNTTASVIQCMRFRGSAGSQFALFSSWSIIPPVSSDDIKVCAPGTGLGMGTYADFVNFCLTGTSTSPHHIFIEMLAADSSIICVKELVFDCELTPPTCASIVEDSLYCDGSATKYTFSVKNNSPFNIYQLDVRLSDTSIKVDQNLIIPSPPIAVGTTGGPYTITITNGFEAGKDFCIYLSAHNNIYNPDSGIAATICCTDSLGVICLPYIKCDSACCDTNTCCSFSGLTIPTGITPNGDSYNDTWQILHPAVCKDIKIVVYNRWGNIVYEDGNYNNNWKGTNQKGELLPQGTYFVVISLTNGSKKGTYIDIRY